MPNAISVLNAVERQSAGETPPSIRDGDKRCGCRKQKSEKPQHAIVDPAEWEPIERGAWRRTCAETGFAVVVAPRRRGMSAQGEPNGRWHYGIISPSGNLLRAGMKAGVRGFRWRGNYATAICAAWSGWGALKFWRTLTLWQCAECGAEMAERAAVASCWMCMGVLCNLRCAGNHANADCD